MSELVTFKWSKERILWGLNLIIAFLESMIGWAGGFCEDDNIYNRLKLLRDEAKDARDQLGYIENS